MRIQREQEFEMFKNSAHGSQFTPDFMTAPPTPAIYHQQAPQQMMGGGDWANEFSKMSLNTATPPPSQQQFHNQMHHQPPPQWGAEFLNSAPQTTRSTPIMSTAQTNNTMYPQFQTAPNISRQTEHRQQHHLHADEEAQARAFEDVFSQVEESLKQQEPEESSAAATEHDDLSGVAKTIVTAISDNSNSMASHTSQKLQNSKFMALMQKISEKEVTLEGEKFVDQSGNDAVTTESNEQEVIKEPAPEPTTAEARLPDPFDYIQQQQEEQYTKEENDVKPNVLSPFEYAQAFGPNGLAQKFNWEERYHEDDVWAM